MTNYMTQLKNAKKTCFDVDKLRKVHYDFGDGREMAEEYNLDTHVVVRRAWKKKTNLGGSDVEWDIELGDPEPTINKGQDNYIMENQSQPFVSRRNTKANLEWRIRNLPYPIETYSVNIDKETNNIIVKTANKKYYKVLEIPEMKRLNLIPEQKNIQYSHKFNTLVITYHKPEELLEFEKNCWKEAEQLQPKNYGDLQGCKPS